MGVKWPILAVMFCSLCSCSSVADSLRAEGFAMPTMGDIHTIAAADTGQVIDLWGLVGSNGATIAQNIANGGLGQGWSLRAEEDGSVSIVNNATHKCLEVPNGSDEGGVAVQQWGCRGSANQRWFLRAQGNGFELANAQSGKCLDRLSDNVSNGAQLQQWGCLGRANQTWTFKAWRHPTAALTEDVNPSAHE